METQEILKLKPNGQVILHLPENTYKQYRIIGKIISRIFFTTRSNSKNQTYHYLNSVGFNYRLISDFDITLICVNYDNENLWTSKEAVLKNGRFTNYKNNGLDKQIHLNLNGFKYTKSEAEKEMNELINETQRIIDYEKQYRQMKNNSKEKIKDLQLSLVF